MLSVEPPRLIIIASVSNVSKLEHGLASNTSFSIVSTSDGNRHLFFQEQGGNIRQAFYNVSEASWSISAGYIVVTNAKYNANLGAVIHSG